ncbi:MAG: hypothetical protein LBI39_03045, partial [Puniceicoccales bacterium]|nr:hypothetical protein [Puniceicoccales bacterium]
AEPFAKIAVAPGAAVVMENSPPSCFTLKDMGEFPENVRAPPLLPLAPFCRRPCCAAPICRSVLSRRKFSRSQWDRTACGDELYGVACKILRRDVM